MTGEDKILGVWTREEFIDTLVFALIAGIITAVMTVVYRYVSKWLELNRWS